jgi:hypothetical protein
LGLLRRLLLLFATLGFGLGTASCSAAEKFFDFVSHVDSSLR